MNRQECASFMHSFCGGKRSDTFFNAWMVEEHGWVETIPNNNPANISGPINHELAWFNGAERLLENNVVVFDTIEHGCQATVLLMEHYYPHVFTAATDVQALEALGQPDIFGEMWATNPEYAQQLVAIYHEMVAKAPANAPTSGHISGEVLYHRVIAGDTLSELAVKYGISLAEIEHLNPQIVNPNQIYVGEQVRVR